MKPKVIAFTGPKGVGKSTLTNNLVALLNAAGKSVKVISFASPLKRMAAAILDPRAFTAEYKENPDFGLCGKTPRHIMQTLGTEWGRKCIDPEIWVAITHRDIHLAGTDIVIIDDCRFDNEARMVQSMGGHVVLLGRNGIEYTGEHPSEQVLPENFIDASLSLDGTSPEQILDALFGYVL